MVDATAGDPMTGQKWSRKTTYSISEELRDKEIAISPRTVSALLQEQGYSLKSNRKEIAESSHPDRNQQFGIIAQIKKKFEDLGQPIISVDSKKKELIGNFKNAGETWRQDPERVLNHDFPSQAVGKAIPYGIYELLENHGTVVIGTSHDTPEFAVESIELWLVASGWTLNPSLKEVLILCDSGGSNGYRARAWKYSLYTKICLSYGISMAVCHYPPGASKWNPVDHRLFSFISLNWAGIPLRSYDRMLDLIQNTTTRKGLKVEAFLNEKSYDTGAKISNVQMKEINISTYEDLPQWNYTINP